MLTFKQDNYMGTTEKHRMMEPPTTEAKPTEHNNHVLGPSSPLATSPNSPLAVMLELLRQQKEERRATAVSLAQSVLRACGSAGGTGGGNRAREIAQATAHEALRCAKANSGNKNSSSAHHQGSEFSLEDLLAGKGAVRFFLSYQTLARAACT